MQPDTYAILGFMALFGGGFAGFFLRRMDAIQGELKEMVKEIRSELAGFVRKNEFEQFRGDVSAQFSSQRSEISEVRSEISAVRSEISAVRSDITQIAIALGVKGWRASEG